MDLIELIGGDWSVESGGKITSILANNQQGTMSRSKSNASGSERLKSLNPINHIVVGHDKRRPSQKKSTQSCRATSEKEIIIPIEMEHAPTEVGQLIGEDKLYFNICFFLSRKSYIVNSSFDSGNMRVVYI